LNVGGRPISFASGLGSKKLANDPCRGVPQEPVIFAGPWEGEHGTAGGKLGFCRTPARDHFFLPISRLIHDWGIPDGH